MFYEALGTYQRCLIDCNMQKKNTGSTQVVSYIPDSTVYQHENSHRGTQPISVKRLLILFMAALSMLVNQAIIPDQF